MESLGASSSSIDRIIVPPSSLKKMSDWFFCRICHMIMLRVYQLACGHLVCSSCKKMLEKTGLTVCRDDPNCFSSDISSTTKIFEDRCQGRAIQNFKTECINAPFGCSWYGELTLYAAHYSECEKRPEKSVEVNGFYFEKSIPLKVKRGAGQLLENEEFQKPSRSMLADSLVECPYCQKNGLLTSELQDHIEHECSKAALSCPFTKVGCPELKRQTREHLEEHARIGLEVHLNLLLRNHLSLQRICTDEFDKSFEMNKKIRSFVEQFTRMNIDLTALGKKFELKFHEHEDRYAEIQKVIDRIKSVSQKNSTEHLEARMNNIEAVLACFQEDRMDGATGGGNIEQRLRALETIMQTLTGSLKTQENKALMLEKQLDFKNSRIESLEAQLNSGEITSYDGTLLWRIDDFMRKRHDAITKRKTYILSPPFFSGPRGYKMCIRAYPNGDGQGKGTHLSIFFTILKGPYDAVLPWPFKQVVQFSVLDQTGNQHAEDSFRPDPNSVSFQRPKKDANISSGCPLFLQLSQLDSGGFVRDDCVFLKAKVDGFSL